jgi:hypothetical protein
MILVQFHLKGYLPTKTELLAGWAWWAETHSSRPPPPSSTNLRPPPRSSSLSQRSTTTDLGDLFSQIYTSHRDLPMKLNSSQADAGALRLTPWSTTGLHSDTLYSAGPPLPPPLISRFTFDLIKITHQQKLNYWLDDYEVEAWHLLEHCTSHQE